MSEASALLETPLRSSGHAREPIDYAPWPFFADDEVEAVTAVLRSGKVNQWTGSEVKGFQHDFATWAGTRHAVAMANGSVTLEACLRALKVGPGDEVIVTPRTFMASASCVCLVGATPVFADIDRDSGNVTVQTMDAVRTAKTKAVIPVHLGGWPLDMPAVMAWADQHQISVIEDCAQAHGARVDGRSVGSFGHVNSWSFCQDKIMTTGGEGGMVTLNDDALWNDVWSFKDHGKSYDTVFNQPHPPGFRWLHESIGTNWRMTEMQAVIGRRQLAKLADWTEKRTSNARLLTEAFADESALRVPWPEDRLTHAWYKFYAYLEVGALADGWTNTRLVSEIEQRGAKAFTGSCSEVYLEKAYTSRGIGPSKRLPVAQELGETSLMLMVHPTLSPESVMRTAEVVLEVLKEAKR